MSEQKTPIQKKLSPNAKKRWKSVFKDIKKKKNIYEFNNPQEALTFLVGDKQ